MWPVGAYHLSIESDVNVSRLAGEVFRRVCRNNFDVAGFCIIDLGFDVSSHALRGLMVSLKRELQAIHRERSGRDLLYMSCARLTNR